jgi:hypothetical protein
MSIQFFVHLRDCQSSLMNKMFIVVAKVCVVYPIQMITWIKSMTQIVWLHKVQSRHVHKGSWEIETLYTPPFVYKVLTLSIYGAINSLKPNTMVERCFPCYIWVRLCSFMPCFEMCLSLH